jgi:hypothetical protein
MGAYLVSMEKQVKMECRDYRIGNLTISHEGELKGKLSKVTLNIHADGQFRNLYACWSWSTGILDVTVPSQTAFCDGDSWKNYTTYYAENKSYEYLPKWVYTCRGEKEEICIAVDGDVCYLPQIEPPQRLKGLVDRCMYSGKNLENNNLSIELTIKAMDAMNILDFVKITIFDAEMRKVDDTTEWKYVTELNGEDVGAPDYVYEIPVEG